MHCITTHSANVVVSAQQGAGKTQKDAESSGRDVGWQGWNQTPSAEGTQPAQSDVSYEVFRFKAVFPGYDVQKLTLIPN
jgi:hypothetical protein